jgi:hypothetical protein
MGCKSIDFPRYGQNDIILTKIGGYGELIEKTRRTQGEHKEKKCENSINKKAVPVI